MNTVEFAVWHVALHFKKSCFELYPHSWKINYEICGKEDTNIQLNNL